MGPIHSSMRDTFAYEFHDDSTLIIGLSYVFNIYDC